MAHDFKVGEVVYFRGDPTRPRIIHEIRPNGDLYGVCAPDSQYGLPGETWWGPPMNYQRLGPSYDDC